MTVPLRLLAPLFALLFAMLHGLPAYSQDAEELQREEEEAIRAAVEASAPAVVQIQTFGGLDQVGSSAVADGPTTGLIVSADGYILSSAFNFANQPSQILITLPDGRRAAAEIVARDHARMLVLLRVEGEELLPVAESAPVDALAVGQWAIALGKTYSAETPNISVGIISALRRIDGKVLQTDAKISPSNYGGPLIDIEGQVIGILVPMSPAGGGETAGAEWYDSGIGFAVPLEEILLYLEEMKEGKDLFPGRLGLGLQGDDIYGVAPTVAAIEPFSPASQAGIEVGDIILQADGAPMHNHSQMQQALGRHYAGEEIALLVDRAGEQLSFTIELAGNLRPYQHPFLGILPQRDNGAEEGVSIRYVYPESGAAEAGIQPGDRILSLAGQAIENPTSMREQITSFALGEDVAIQLVRNEETMEIEAALSALPNSIPDALPPAWPNAAEEEAAAEGHVVEIQFPDQTNECFAYLPENYDPELSHGLLVYLHAAGQFDPDALLEKFGPLCDANRVILLAPQAADTSRWDLTEREFIQKVIGHLLGTYSIDRSRVVLYGYQAGGSMAWSIGLGNQNKNITGLVVVDAAPGLRALIPTNDPLHRLAIMVAKTSQDAAAPEGEAEIAGRIQTALDKLNANNIPTTVIDLGEQPHDLDAAQRATLFRWLDTLDRI